MLQPEFCIELEPQSPAALPSLSTLWVALLFFPWFSSLLVLFGAMSPVTYFTPRSCPMICSWETQTNKVNCIELTSCRCFLGSGFARTHSLYTTVFLRRQMLLAHRGKLRHGEVK